MLETKVRPSLLAANFLCLDKDLKSIKDLGIKKVHYDVMDGVFVNKISFGQNIYKTIKEKYTDIDFDVHLMTINPINLIPSFIDLGCKEISFHIETLNGNSFNEYLNLKNKYHDVKFGIAISPDTDINKIDDYVSYFDYILIMSVIPGEGGQSFIKGSEAKIKYLSNKRERLNLSYFIMVDGGINKDTGRLCLDNGCDYLVCGSSFFKCDDRKGFIDSLRK